MLIINLLCYHIWGLTGLGISFFIGYLLVLIQVLVISKIKFEFTFTNNFIKLFSIQFTLALLSFLCVFFFNRQYNYFIGFFLIAISVWISYKELDKRINIKGTLIETINRIKNKQ